MNILLDGYFDKNFGDDVMQLQVVKGLPQYDFYVLHQQREMLAHLETVENVHITETLPKIDAYVNVIGTGFQFNGKRAAMAKILEKLFIRSKTYPKNAVINCSIEPIQGKVSAYLTKSALNKYDLITCRDTLSMKYLQKFKLHSAVFLNSDIVFSLLHDQLPPKTNEGCLGVALSRRLYSSTNYSYYQAIAKCCDYFVKKYSKNILLFAFDSGLENDISAALSVKNMMQHPENTEIIAYNSDPNKILSNVARCSRFIGSRFHSVVTALIYQLPVLAVYDMQKLKKLCDEYSVPCMDRESCTAQGLIDLMEQTVTPVKLPAAVADDAQAHISALHAFLEERKT